MPEQMGAVRDGSGPNSVLPAHGVSRPIAHFLGGLWGDVVYGLRLLGRNRGFAAAAILTMAIGIGANTAVFSFVGSTLFFPLPYPNASRIVYGGRQPGPIFEQWARRNKTFTVMSAETEAEMTLAGAGEAERLLVAKVTPSFFRLLGAQPMFGRAFVLSETQPGASGVAILSYELWRSRFGANPRVIGETIHLNDRLYTIVGVTPKRFVFPSPSAVQPALFVPLGNLSLSLSSLMRVGPNGTQALRLPPWVQVLGRLKPAVSLSAAQANLHVILAASGHVGNAPNSLALGLVHAMAGPGARVTFVRNSPVLVSLRDYLLGDYQLVSRRREELLVLWGAVSLLLLIACANVANLALARALSREKEVGVRLALGAHRRRVARQLLTESLLIAALGGVAGTGIAYAAVVLVRTFGPADIPRLGQSTIDPLALGFAALVAALAGVAAGLAPVRAAWRLPAVAALREGGVSSHGRGHRRLRDALVVAEVALGLILAVGAGLLARSFLRLTGIQLHFDPHHVLTAQITLPRSSYAGAIERREFQHSLLAESRHLPGVVSAAATDRIPGNFIGNFLPVQVEGRPAPSGASATWAGSITASPGFFRTAGIHVVEGRGFQPTDSAVAPRVVVVNQAFVRHFFPQTDPLGQKTSQRQTFFMADGRNSVRNSWATIVGVAADVKGDGGRPVVYYPYAQQPTSSFSLLIRTSGNPLAIAPELRRRIEGLDHDLPLFGVATLDKVLGGQVATQRFEAVLFGAFALVGLALATLGVYGVVSYSVSERAHEIGIRMAMGAENAAVMRMVLGKTLVLGLVGVAIGTGGSLGLTRFLQSQLYQVRPDDPATFAIAAGVLLAASLLAGFLPARRATEIDPLRVLRCE